MDRHAQPHRQAEHDEDEEGRPRLLLSFQRWQGDRRHRRDRQGASIPTRPTSREAFVCVDVKAVQDLPQTPVTLAAIKAEPKLAEMAMHETVPPVGAADHGRGMEDALQDGRTVSAADAPNRPIGDPAVFIRANTRLLPVPLVPEIVLHVGRRSGAAVEQDRRRTRRDRPAAAVLGLCLGRRPGAGALRARSSRACRRQDRASISHRVRAWWPSRR